VKQKAKTTPEDGFDGGKPQMRLFLMGRGGFRKPWELTIYYIYYY
jgi:hypothetical protein